MVVLISGKQGSGKSTIATRLQYDPDIRGSIQKFARPLYELHDLILSYLKKEGIQRPEKDRALLQIIGTEYGRNNIHIDVWAQIALNFATAFTSKVGGYLIFDDLRFENEMDLFKNSPISDKCFFIRLNCPEDIRRQRTEFFCNPNHPSEVGLDHRMKDFDLIVDTRQSIDSTYLTIKNAILEKNRTS